MKESIRKENIPQDIQEAPAFTPRYLDTEKQETNSEILTIRLNAKERALIDKLKEVLHYSQDAKVIKIGLAITNNVIQHTFSYDIMDKLCAEDRRRTLIDTPPKSENP